MSLSSPVAAALLVLAAAAAAACGSSEAPSSPPSVSLKDGGSPPDAHAEVASASKDAGAEAPRFTLDSGITWTALYRDYFGPTGVASCAGDGDCHGGSSQPGFVASGYLCPTGNQAGCYAGITAVGDGGPGLITPDAAFTDDLLSMVLCQSGPTHFEGASMPLYCPYTFTHTDLARLAAWVAAGAPDD